MSSSLRLFSFLLLCTCSLSLSVSGQHHVSFSTYRSLAARLRQQPFDPEMRDEIIKSMKIAMSMYTFRNLNLDSTIGAPAGLSIWEQKNDVMSSIDQVSTTTYLSQYDMDEAMNQIFLPLNDAHTGYRKAYDAFAFTLPFRLSSHLVTVNLPPFQADTRTHIFLKDTIKGFSTYQMAYGYSPLANVTFNGAPASIPSIEGWEVTEINGVSAVHYLWNLASLNTTHHVGISKDQNTRYNLLTHGYNTLADGPPGWYSFRGQSKFGIPDESEEFVTMTIRATPESLDRYTIVFQWIGLGPEAGQMDFDETHFPKPTPKKSHMVQVQQMEHFYHSIHSLQHPALYKQRAAVEGSAPKKPFVKSTPKVDADYVERAHANGQSDYSINGTISFTVLPDNTGVLQINNFEPDDNTAFLTLIQTAISNHQQNLGGTKLIIDLRGNGGGDICLGYSVLRFLFPQILQPSFGVDASDGPYGRYDTIIAPLTQFLADLGSASLRTSPANNPCNFFTPCAWLNPSTQTPYANEEWFNSGRTLERGGVMESFTALFHDNCASYYGPLAPSDINPGYQPKNVIMMSDGMCGSTCSVFSSFIFYNKLAKSVTFGGTKTKQHTHTTRTIKRGCNARHSPSSWLSSLSSISLDFFVLFSLVCVCVVYSRCVRCSRHRFS